MLKNLQKIESTKKEKDAKSTMEQLDTQLQEAMQNIKQVSHLPLYYTDS